MALLVESVLKNSMKAYIDTRPLVHKVWAHAENDAVQIASFGGIANHFAPAWLFFVTLSLDGVKDFLELALNLFVIKGLVQKPANGMLGLNMSSVLVANSSCINQYTSSILPRDASQRGVSHKNGHSASTISEKRIWQATGKRHCSELLAYSVAKHNHEAIATPMMIRADCTTSSEPRLCAGRVSDCRIGTATVDSPTPTPAMIRETNICLEVHVKSAYILRGIWEQGHIPIVKTGSLNRSPKNDD